jgi:hypothetical protein
MYIDNKYVDNKCNSVSIISTSIRHDVAVESKFVNETYVAIESKCVDKTYVAVDLGFELLR